MGGCGSAEYSGYVFDERMKKMIENISIEKLHLHPKNPRKSVGDVSELAESIKKNGVLQNLTVVPGKIEGTYTVIIGHRINPHLQ